MAKIAGAADFVLFSAYFGVSWAPTDAAQPKISPNAQSAPQKVRSAEIHRFAWILSKELLHAVKKAGAVGVDFLAALLGELGQ